MPSDESISLRDVSPVSFDQRTAPAPQSDQDESHLRLQRPNSSHIYEARRSHNNDSWSSLLIRIITGSWGLELLCWVVAALSLAVIIVVLAIFNGQPLNNWHSGITVNALINVISTVGQTSILGPVAESISQLKWIWYRRGQPVGDMEDFDKASRGPIDSLLLIVKRPKWLLVYLGAFNMSLIILFGAFAQQSVQTALRQVGAGTGSIANNMAYQISTPPLGRAFLSGGGGSSFTFDSVAYIMQLGIIQALLKPNISPSELEGDCPKTGNCTYGIYTTMGVCSSVDDVTPSLVKDCPPQEDGTNSGCSYTVPDLRNHPTYQKENFSSRLDNTLWVGSSMVDPQGYRFPKANTLVEFYVIYLSDFSVLSLDSKANYTAALVALKGTLDMCVYTYSTTVTNGVTNTIQIDVSTNLNWQTTQKDLDQTDTTVVAATDSNGAEYYMTEGARFAFNNYLSSVTFQGTAEITNIQDPKLPLIPSNDNVQAISTSVANGGGIQGLSKLMTNLATSMTNALRTTSDVSSTAPGNATTYQVYISVDFRWLIVPIASVIFAFIFLLAVMAESRRCGVPAWKSSQTAALLCLDEAARKQVGPLDTAKRTMGKRADGVRVRLQREGRDGWQLAKV